MLEPFQNEQKETAAAAEIQNALGRSAMKLQILDAFAVHPQPQVDIRVFFSGIALLNFLDPALIDAGEHWSKWKSKDGALKPTPTSTIRFASRELGEFAMNFHESAFASSRRRPGPR